MRYQRVVLDTNVLLSRLISRDGTAGKAFDHAFRLCTLLMAAETIAELAAKLASPKIARYATETERQEFLSAVCHRAEIVELVTVVDASTDPKDNMILALAVEGRADCIVSGDKKHLQVLGTFEGIPIMSPTAFLDFALEEAVE